VPKVRQKARPKKSPSIESIRLVEQPANPASDALRITFLVCAFVICAAGCLYLTFLDRELFFDEVGLYNPPYMFQHYGRITYPVHAHFDDMVIHPPTHYLVIGALLRMGLTLPHAAAVEPVILLSTACVLLVLSRFPLPIKFGLLFGTFLGALVWNDLLTVRPDLSLALAWIAGLIALESARLSNWSPWRLAIGSLLLVYASAVHYPGVLAQAGVIIYAVWACFALPWRRLPAALGSLMVGPCLVGIPYLLLFVIPFQKQIRETVVAQQGEGGPLTALRHHIETYDIWLHGWSFNLHHQPFVQSLLLPVWFLHIPVALVGFLLLFAFRSCRGLAIAALPQVLFIVFGARHKQPGYSGYFAPEAILYLSAVIAVFFAMVFHIVSRIKIHARAIAGAVATVACFTALALHDQPGAVWTMKFTRDLKDLDIGRAASRAILGPSALVGTAGAGVWYTGGAAHLYPRLKEDLLYPATIAGLNLKEYFSQFDAVVLGNAETWATWNKERQNLTSLFASGGLNLKGFWFADRRRDRSSSLTLLMLGVNQEPVQGFATYGGKTYRFEPSPQADSVFFCAVCPIGDLRSDFQFNFYATFFIPWKNNDDPIAVTDPGDPRPVIRMLLVSREQFQQEVLPLAARCKTRYQIAGRLVEVDQNAMVSELRRNDQPIKFYRSIAAALGGSGRLNRGNTERVPGAIQLDKIRASVAANLSKGPDGWQVKIQPATGSEAVFIPIENVNKLSGGYVYVRAKESVGTVGLTVLNSRTYAFAGPEVQWEAHDPTTEIYIPVQSFDGVDQLVIRNLDEHGSSQILIKDLAVVTVPRSNR
jgi:hypothetical protein